MTSPMDTDVSLLAMSDLLRPLTRDAIVALAMDARHLRVASGETLFSMGGESAYVYWVKRGRLKLLIPCPKGTRLLYRMVEQGDSCGEIPALDGGALDVTAVAEQFSEVVAVDRKLVVEAIEREPGASMNLARLLSSKLRSAETSLASIALQDAEARIWTRLMELAKVYGSIDDAWASNDPDGPSLDSRESSAGPQTPPGHGERRSTNRMGPGPILIHHGQSQQDLADSVGLTRVMVNRQLKAWRQRGLIEDGRGYVRVPSPEELRAYVLRENRST